MKGLSPIVYLPIEFQAREFDAKALLAARLAAMGYPVLIGQQWTLFGNLERLPPGTILFKSFNGIHQRQMHAARSAGFHVVVLEEELLAQTEEKNIRRICAPGALEAADLILCNGEFEREVLGRAGGAKVPMEPTGNPRVDLLKPAYRAFFRPQVDALLAQHGEFVLVNTNLPAIHSLWQNMDQVLSLQKHAGFVRDDDPATLQMWRDYLAYEEANREGIVAAVRELARRRPRQRIVLRPHPGEDPRRWDGVFPGAPNVAVIREGSHVPWTLAGQLLLHTSCTTGFEAQVAGKRALSLVPRPSWVSDSLLCNRLNEVFHDPMEMVAAAERILDGAAATPPPVAGIAERYVSNCGAEDASLRIARALAQTLPPPSPLEIPPLLDAGIEERVKNKAPLTMQDCADTLRRVSEATGVPPPVARQVGASLFLVVAAGAEASVASSAPVPGHAQLLAAMQAACQAGQFQKAYDLFHAGFGEAHRHGDLCFLAGFALFESGKHALALQYFQGAAVAANAMDANLAHWTARTHHRLGDLELALRYAGIAWRQMPGEPAFFDLYRELARRTRRDAPRHWMVIGCSQVRYFRYMQVNAPQFFGERVHLECHEFGGATAYALGSADSPSGVVGSTRKLRGRMRDADRIVLMFGDLDVGGAARQAAAMSGRSIDDTIAESAARLEAYLQREVLPYNGKVAVLGAKPRVGEDQRAAQGFNCRLRGIAKRAKADYAEIDRPVADEELDSVAALYHERLRALA